MNRMQILKWIQELLRQSLAFNVVRLRLSYETEKTEIQIFFISCL